MKKVWPRRVLSFSRETRNAHFNSENDVTEPKARLL